MSHTQLVFLATILLLPPSPLTAAPLPPREVTDRLERALKALEPGAFQGTFTLRVTSAVSKPDGSGREDQTEVLEVVQPASGEALTRVIHADASGKDVTASRQREIDHETSSRQGKATSGDSKGSESISVTTALPAGEDAALYEFGPPTLEGGLLVASFAPRAGERNRDGVATGRLAWRGDTLDPVWVEARPVKLPKHASELSLRFELGREGELLHLRRMITDGAGGMLWIKRKIHAELEISEVRQAR